MQIAENFILDLRNAFATARRWVVTKPLKTFIALAIALVLLCLFVRTYQFDNLGFKNKNMWNWLELLIVPLTLAFAAWLLESSNKRVEWSTTADTNRQQMMDGFIVQVKDTIAKEGLAALRKDDSDVRSVIKAQALAVFRALDGTRKGYVLKFLHELDLLKSPSLLDTPQADLSGADLRKMDFTDLSLRNGNLTGANMAGAILVNARLTKATLVGANLSFTELMFADLREADLTNANLNSADLREADLSRADLTGASLKDAKAWSAKMVNAKVTEEQMQKVARRTAGASTTVRSGGNDGQ